MTKVYGLLQLIIICTFTCAIIIGSYTSISKFCSFIIFSLLINAGILLFNYFIALIHPIPSYFYLYLRIYTTLLLIILSPGQKRGTCGHVMALFDSHKKCVRCREKGVGDDSCVKKLDCQICKAFTPAQIQQLSTPTTSQERT